MEIKSQVQTQLVLITFLPESSRVEHHDGHLLGIGILGVILDPFEELLDQGVPGVDLQGLLLVEIDRGVHKPFRDLGVKDIILESVLAKPFGQ